MKSIRLMNCEILATIFCLVLSTPVLVSQETESADVGWPREFASDNKKLIIYQPQVDEWVDHANLRFRCAIEVEGILAEPKFGVAEIEARTLVDQTARTVKLFPTKRELRFSGVSTAEEKSLRDAVDAIRPPGQLLTISLDRVIACLDPESAAKQKSVDVNLNPPKIYYSNKPAVLVMFMGEPQFKPVIASDPDLMFAINTNWDVFYQPSTKAFYLLNNDHWLTATKHDGPWTVATSLPEKMNNLPADENWEEVRKQIPAKGAKVAEQVFASNSPTELIVTTGEPEYNPIPNTRLLEVTNTESLLLLDSAGGKFYYQAAGRWFRASKLDGTWEAASNDLPEDFRKIPDAHPLAYVKATVPGTDDARDAVLLASVPQATYVDATKAPNLEVTYKGEPVFQPIPPTSVKYAVNSPFSVFLVGSDHYCCDQGVWFSSKSANGPWTWATTVPAEIYQIPVTSPVHNVTYVTIENSSPDTIVYTQTAGYSGEYVAANGILMFGAGLLTAAIINDADDHHCYPPVAWYSYGCGAVYHHGYGGYYAAAGRRYGPYGGVGYVAAYNPATGIYTRGAYAYGPYGSAGYRQAYNPYTGTYAAAGYRATPHGSVAAGRVYNPYTGATAAGGRVSTRYGSAGRAAAYNPVTGKAVAGAYVSGENGSVAVGRNNEGGKGVKWENDNGQGTVVKTKNDNIYAAHDGTVYRKDSDGNWTSNSGGNWQPVEKPQPKAPPLSERPSTQPIRPNPRTETRPSLETFERTRSRGDQQTERAKSFQRSGGSGTRRDRR